MFADRRLSDQSRKSVKYGLIGGLASIPFSLGLYWQSGMGTQFTANMVVLGGVLAGFLAKRGSARASNAGICAGVIGGIPILIWNQALLLGIPDGFVRVWWSAPVLEVLFSLTVVLAFLLFFMIAGLIGGLLGGWLLKKVDRRRTRSVGT